MVQEGIPSFLAVSPTSLHGVSGHMFISLLYRVAEINLLRFFKGILDCTIKKEKDFLDSIQDDNDLFIIVQSRFYSKKPCKWGLEK